MTTRRTFLSAASASLLAPRLMAQAGSGPDADAAPAVGGGLRAVSYRSVEIADPFWAPRQQTNRLATVPHLLEQMTQQGYVSNFERATQGLEGGYRGPRYMDSDLYKSLEAAAYVLGRPGGEALVPRVNALIELIRGGQEKDGYLNTWIRVNGKKRYQNLRDDHELYCAGHLIEAGVAHREATGENRLFDVAVRFADQIERTFGDAPGKRPGYCGHPEIELALFRLAAATGEKRFRDLAVFFLEHRGEGFFAQEHAEGFVADYDGTYFLDHAKLRDHRIITGHAVRALYLLCAAADFASLTGDPGVLAMMDRVWKNATLKRLFLTGGLGSSSLNEGFTNDYDLPNLSAYQESCASVAAAMWAHRLCLLRGDARYADLMEQSFYNAVAAGVALEGRTFFYANPLASDGTQHRRSWYGTACCPPNLARAIGMMGGYAYAASDRALFVNLYLRGRVDADLAQGKVRVLVETEYPWEGKVAVRVAEAPPAGFDLRLRVPGWCGAFTLLVNEKPREAARPELGYVVARGLRAGDRVELHLPMPVRRIEADPRVEEAAGRVALQRGPIVYCVEQADHDRPLASLVLPAGAALRLERSDAVLSGVPRLVGEARAVLAPEEEGGLYRDAPFPRREQPATLTAVPYGVWDNRTAGPMKVWIRNA